MKISRNWLQQHFEQPLPDAETLSTALTFHAFEIDGVEQHGDDFVLDVKVTPNRGHDCLCHRGIAKELSAILEMPMKADQLKIKPTLSPTTSRVSVVISEPSLCARYVAGHIKGVKVGPSPAWLVQMLEAIGQRSINNVVDATNFVMFNLGQPLHAFDASKLSSVGGEYGIQVRRARAGEKITALDHKEYTLSESMLVIAEVHADAAIGIAGVKGGLPAGVDETTTDIIIESANFDGVSVRKTAAALKLRTDASSRYEQVISPELAGYGMQAVVDMIRLLAGGELVGFTDVYLAPQAINPVSVTAAKVNSVLGTQFPASEMEKALVRLDLAHMTQSDTFTVTPRFERLDLTIPEDLIEEIGRIIGYDKVTASELPAIPNAAAANDTFQRIEYTREQMIRDGYSEVYTSVFADKGERAVLNKVGGDRPFMRSNIKDSLADALTRNARIKDSLGLKKVKLFEIGTVWSAAGEEIRVAAVEEKGEVKEYALSDVPKPDEPVVGERSRLEQYKAFSKYPFISRDIAMWVPTGTTPETVFGIMAEIGGPLLTRIDLFDTFVKGDKTSLAFRLIFQSFDKTLTDDEVAAIMTPLTAALTEHGFEIR
jgi:phenylalanyl-tRNA synthetase beta chain